MNLLLYITIAGLAFLLLILYSPNISLWLQGLQLKLELKKKYYEQQLELAKKQKIINEEISKETKIANYYAITSYCLNELNKLGENVTGDSSDKEPPTSDTNIDTNSCQNKKNANERNDAK